MGSPPSGLGWRLKVRDCPESGTFGVEPEDRGVEFGVLSVTGEFMSKGMKL